jgi:hypothetical protein
MVNDNAAYFREVINRYKGLLNKSKDVVGLIAIELFQSSFDYSGQVMGNGAIIKWPGRGFHPPSSNGRSLLVKKGKLRRNMDYRKSSTGVILKSDLPYSEIQNDGGTIKVTAKMRRFFFAMYYKQNSRVVYTIADKGVKNTKANVKRNTEAEFWLKMAMAKQITIPPRPFFYDTPELPRRIDKYFIEQINTITQ